MKNKPVKMQHKLTKRNRKDYSKSRKRVDRHKPKKRNSTYKAEKNLHREKVYELITNQLCIDHNLNYNDFASIGKKTTFWYDTCWRIYKNMTKSFETIDE
jgi:hypothetical protein